jgi:hypothetical protein
MKEKYETVRVKEVLKGIRFIAFEKSFKPECTTHSEEFQDGAPSKDEIIPQSEVFEDNMVCMKFSHMPKLSPRTNDLAVPLYWYR